MITVLGVIVGLLILTVIVAVHELGHAIAARRAGVVVEEFGIGFPPRAWSKKLKNGILVSVNWLPLGGFLKMQGPHDAANKKGDYGRANLWQKTQILFGGVVFNLIFAAMIFTVLAWIGMPKLLDNQFTVANDTRTTLSPVMVSFVEPGAPADQAGLKRGDELVSVAQTPIEHFADVSRITSEHQGENVTIDFKRDGELLSVQTTLRSENEDRRGFLGIGIGQSETIRATWSAPIVGVATTVQLTYETVKGVGQLFANFFGGLVRQLSFSNEVRDEGRQSVSQAGDGVAGPIGIIGELFPQALRMGPVPLLMLAGIISLSLAVMNALPIPALDGGRWLIMVIFRLLKKKLTPELEEKINATGFMVLIGLILLITVVDVARFF